DDQCRDRRQSPQWLRASAAHRVVPPAAGSNGATDRTFNKGGRWFFDDRRRRANGRSVPWLLLLALVRGDDEHCTDYGEREFEMKVDRKRADIPKPIPDGPYDGQIDRLDLDSQPQTIQFVKLRNICLHRPQGTGNNALAGVSLN